jgi:cell division septum initiation protein DivIVA
MYRILLFSILAIFYACQNSETDRAKSQLEEANDQIAALQVENQKLNDRIGNLSEDLYQLDIEKEMITNRYNELNNWANRLKNDYGTGIWQTDDSTFPVFKRSMKSASVSEIIKELNKIYQENGFPKVILKKVDGTTVYLTVDNSEQLTQRMGTSGASSYIKEVFFTVASVEGVKCVDLDFEEGDHAAPGGYCK